ncbi:2og-Fe oxygenase family protein [Grosmannia clavigera kw1407]|uniref:2og-Fe oxygenase family protein n=1 Tax=Grosmannia clavigera (strain kw1407 / UAMH 11150) TaxID=655863 RepID=F0XKP1_GROCL|nr:2og-Fe oxygenase family protein [Grosmannia clavigera kw1407]EFX01571.1 2og-Fe oxygenase family protein [Grosmannia clavigera kw1407]
MPSAVPVQSSPLRRWVRPDKTRQDLPWADIAAIDLSKFDQPGGKDQLVEDLRQAVHETGFFGLINTGFTPEENNDKKMLGPEVRNNSESVNIPKFTAYYANEPFHSFFEPYRDEIESFSRRSLDLASRVFRLFALILELPEDFFSSRHEYSLPSEDHLRYMRYHPRTLADDVKVERNWSRAHTDFGSLTLLWSQDVAGLQIKTRSGEWRYVPPLDGGIICNVGDTLDFWSAGYLKSTIHRVIRPPEDQASQFRLGLFYFVRPGDDVDIKPAPSPLLKRLRLVREDSGEAELVTGLQYVRERVKNYHDHDDYTDKRGQTFKLGSLEIEDQAA